jgi:hypothetical protein
LKTAIDGVRAAICDGLSEGPNTDASSPLAAARNLWQVLPDRFALAEFLMQYLDVDDESSPHGLSHIHPIGFMKLSLLRYDGQRPWRLRLHIWPGAGRDAFIHNHRWNFASLVVAGELDIYNYVSTGRPGAIGFQMMRVWDADSDAREKVDALGPGRLSLACSYHVAEGATHSLYFEQPHIIAHGAGSAAATLVITDQPVRDYSYLYAEAAEDADDLVSRIQPGRSLSRDEVHAELARFGRRLLSADREPAVRSASLGG